MSRHAWSVDGVTWTGSPYAAFGSTVEYTDGSVQSFARRERPHLILDDEGHPTHLISGVQPGGYLADYSYTLVQPTCSAATAAAAAARGLLAASA